MAEIIVLSSDEEQEKDSDLECEVVQIEQINKKRKLSSSSPEQSDCKTKKSSNESTRDEELSNQDKDISGSGTDTSVEEINTSDEETDTSDEELPRETKDAIKKTKSKIIKCRQKIKILEEKDVDLDDEKNSSFLKIEKYQKRIIKFYNALGTYKTNGLIKKELNKKRILRKKHIKTEMTGIDALDDYIINKINKLIKKVNRVKHTKKINIIAECFNMPDYKEFLNHVTEGNKELKLNLTKSDIDNKAQKAYKSVGRCIQRMRGMDTKNYLESLVDCSANSRDPAENDPEWTEKLKQNKQEAIVKLQELQTLYNDFQDTKTPEELAKLEESTE